MWRMLRALELDLVMSKECSIDAVFQYWHDKNIHCKRGRKIGMGVEKRLMDIHWGLWNEKIKGRTRCRLLVLCPNMIRDLSR